MNRKNGNTGSFGVKLRNQDTEAVKRGFRSSSDLRE